MANRCSGLGISVSANQINFDLDMRFRLLQVLAMVGLSFGLVGFRIRSFGLPSRNIGFGVSAENLFLFG